MSAVRVVTPIDSTASRVVGSPNRAMPHTSLSPTRDCAIPKAIRPAGPVMRIFSSLSMDGPHYAPATLSMMGANDDGLAPTGQAK